MVMIVKHGQLPPPTWENRLMLLLPQGKHWQVRMEDDGFYAQFAGEPRSDAFESWEAALVWVARRFGISDQQMREVGVPDVSW